VKGRHLADLERLRHTLALRQAQEAEAERARQALQESAELERRLFAETVGKVTTLPDKRLARLEKTLPAPLAVQQRLDEQAVLRESLSDEFDVQNLLDTDAALSFRRPGIGSDVTRKLRKGEWALQAELDLHGMRRDQARAALAAFIRACVKSGLRCVRVIHGKGLGSPGKAPVLKSHVHSWLVQKNEVLAFVQAKPTQGGAGALMVLLRPR
jgi:DNA-nicking Smr family endonuclease